MKNGCRLLGHPLRILCFFYFFFFVKQVAFLFFSVFFFAGKKMRESTILSKKCFECRQKNLNTPLAHNSCFFILEIENKTAGTLFGILIVNLLCF